jgi:hypothetical protein
MCVGDGPHTLILRHTCNLLFLSVESDQSHRVSGETKFIRKWSALLVDAQFAELRLIHNSPS